MYRNFSFMSGLSATASFAQYWEDLDKERIKADALEEARRVRLAKQDWRRRSREIVNPLQEALQSKGVEIPAYRPWVGKLNYYSDLLDIARENDALPLERTNAINSAIRQLPYEPELSPDYKIRKHLYKAEDDPLRLRVDAGKLGNTDRVFELRESYAIPGSSGQPAPTAAAPKLIPDVDPAPQVNPRLEMPKPAERVAQAPASPKATQQATQQAARVADTVSDASVAMPKAAGVRSLLNRRNLMISGGALGLAGAGLATANYLKNRYSPNNE